MEESQVAEISKRKQVRQPPAVPFLWEVKPGIPKRDWKPEVSSLSPSPVVTPPIKLIASIPFDWEEKPGTPLPHFAELVLLPTPQEMLYNLPPPPGCSHGYDGIDSDNEDSDNDHDEQRSVFNLDLEAFDFDTDDSFSSAPSLLANCLVPSEAISSAIPAQKSSSSDDASDEPEIPSSPASETYSSTSSYATGTSSPVGASFLECLFPLLPPKSSFLEREEQYERGSLTPSKVKSKDFDRESNCSVVIRRPATLAELIMMSRRRSYQRKAVQMRKQNLSKEFEKGLLGALELVSK